MLLALLLAFQSGRMVEVGREVGGVVSDSSTPQPGGRRAEIFGFQCVSALEIQVDVESGWDNLAVIFAPDGRVVAQDDDSGGQNNARIAWTCPDNQLYRIAVESYHVGSGGPFSLLVSSVRDNAQPRLPFAGRITSSIGLESEVRGALGPGAERYGGHPIVYYAIRCRTGQVLGIDATSDFDNLLYLFGASGEVDRNDDANGTSARLVYTCPDDGSYRIGVAAQHAELTGPFRLNVRNLSLPTGPITVRAVRRPRGAPLLFPGARLDGSVASDADQFENRPAVSYTLQCQARLPLRIDATSTWDNRLWLLSATALLAANDDAGGTTNARIDWTCPDAGIYTIVVGASNPSQVGPFVLSVTPLAAGIAPRATAASLALVGTVFPGAVIEGNLLRPRELYTLQCVAGESVELRLASRFENYVTIEDSSGTLRAGASVTLAWTCPDAAIYRVGVAARVPGGSGRYRLTMR